jgi:hypothetical protein
MNTRSLKPGDPLECKVKGTTFKAHFVEHGQGIYKGLVKVEPVEDWPTWRFLRPRQIERKLETQERMAVGV